MGNIFSTTSSATNFDVVAFRAEVKAFRAKLKELEDLMATNEVEADLAALNKRADEALATSKKARAKYEAARTANKRESVDLD